MQNDRKRSALRWTAVCSVLGWALVSAAATQSTTVSSLSENFATPPASARPWVYWFWNNGNVTRVGITADLEAMKRVGIGGVLIMDVVERFAPPRGPATFMSDTWRGDFQFALSEAARLGLQVNMTNAAGWCGSSGPWITPELSMQKLVVTETTLEGPSHVSIKLPKLPPRTTTRRVDILDSVVSVGDFYRDVAVLAFPAPEKGVVPHDAIIDLSKNMDASGELTWDAPPGKWIVQRYGHVSTGASTRPPVLGGNGLECDRLNAAAMDLHFAHFIAKLKADAGPVAGKAMVATHIDSWESGSQNWTDQLPAEFQRRCGYSLLPYLPAYATNSKINVDSKALSDRFRWDFYQTISDMLVENYSGRLATLAHGQGLRLTMEGYDLPFGDEATYTSAADEPMTEFWTVTPRVNPRNASKAFEMASVAHVFGRRIVGAEAFTSGDQEMWRYHPAMLKAMGDNFFAQGVNRFVFHRYAHQPWLDRAPGATMGPWGLHYERTNTWWEMSGSWHKYIARCQYLLRQGDYVADVLFLRPQHPNETSFHPEPLPAGYRSDQISATALIDRVHVEKGRLTLPDGMSYRLLELPSDTVINPELAEKLRDLINAGAVVLGPRPTHAPGLSDFPNCDRRVAAVADAVWGPVGTQSIDRACGNGRLLSGIPLRAALQKLAIAPDLTSTANINWIHRNLGSTDIYFIANPASQTIDSDLSFRCAATDAQLWNPQNGERSALPVSPTEPGRANVHLTLGPTDSCFVILDRNGLPSDGLVTPLKPLQPVADLSKDWDVNFPPREGAPDHVHMDSLSSLTNSTDFGVQHFSGTASYKRTFEFNPTPAAQSRRLVLDLGDVQVMAHVTLNGKDLGVAWKAPYQVEITGPVHPGTNKLSIDVADLWPNRLIGDASLPEDKRIGWSTWEPFKANMPLSPAGLIGPVQVMIEK